MVLASAGSLPGSSYRICSDKITLLYTSYWCSDSPPPPHLLFLRDSCSRLGKDKTTLRPNYSQLHQLLKRISRKQLCQQPATAWRLLLPFPTIPVKQLDLNIEKTLHLTEWDQATLNPFSLDLQSLHLGSLSKWPSIRLTEVDFWVWANEKEGNPI